MIKNFFFLKSYRFWENMEDYGTVRQATDDDIIRACVLYSVKLKLQTHTQNT